MTFDDRARALEAWGFTPRQARFLVFVALHSGYCLRRQYVAAAHVGYGKNANDFLEALVARKLATRFSVRADRGHIYHLRSRTFYRAIGQEDNRHRRQASAAVMATKLMLLDFVLAHAGVEWLATEEDKVQLSVDRLGLALEDLPQHTYESSRPGTPSTIRFFPHKLPMGVTGSPPDVRFVFPVYGHAGNGFHAFLRDHAAMFGRLSTWTIVVAGPARSQAFAPCQAAFTRFRAHPVSRRMPQSHDLRAYFKTREAIDRGRLAQLPVAEINRYRHLRDRFQGPDVEARYRDWLNSRDPSLRASEAARRPASSGAGRLEIASLPFDYAQFGSLPGVA